MDYLVVMKNYYEFVLGLVYYVVFMLNLVKFIVDLYLFFDCDLFYVGVILYDFGKVKELFGFVFILYMVEGNLFGYILIMVIELLKVVEEF